MFELSSETTVTLLVVALVWNMLNTLAAASKSKKDDFIVAAVGRILRTLGFLKG